MIRTLILLACLIAPGLAFALTPSAVVLETHDTIAPAVDQGGALHVTGPAFVDAARITAPSEALEKSMNPFAQMDIDIFKVMASTETYTAPGKPPLQARVIWERGVVTESPDRKTRVVDNTLLAHLLVSEVGRPVRGATLTDGTETHKVDGIQSDDKSVVVCRMV